MKPEKSIKPISYLKAHASELVRDVFKNQNTIIITQNGEAKVVIQDIKAYEETQESIAMLKILAMSNKSLNDKKVKPAGKAFTDIRKKIKANKS